MENINYIVTMLSESYAWVGYGTTAEDAKEMIRRQWEKYLGDSEMTVADMYEYYGMRFRRWHCNAGLIANRKNVSTSNAM